jgi:hypothetical protein
MAETFTWPDWLTGMTGRERLQKIMAAVHRCYMEHEPGIQNPSGPHLTIGMAEKLIAQLLPGDQVQSRADGAPSDEDRIRDAMAEARDHPGRTITR